jgi:hypothetical protein
MPSDGRAPGTALGGPGPLARPSRQPPEARLAPALRLLMGAPWPRGGVRQKQSGGLHHCHHGAGLPGQPPDGPADPPNAPRWVGPDADRPVGRQRSISLRGHHHPASYAERAHRVLPV